MSWPRSYTSEWQSQGVNTDLSDYHTLQSSLSKWLSQESNQGVLVWVLTITQFFFSLQHPASNR